jgi:hypothetical protein
VTRPNKSIKNDPNLPLGTLLAWLNGRAVEIRVAHHPECVDCIHTCYAEHQCRPCLKCGRGYGQTRVLWKPENAISIEQAILNFADWHGIDIKKESGD